MLSGENLIYTTNSYSPIKNHVGEVKVDLGIELQKSKRLISTITKKSKGQLFSIFAPCWDNFKCDMSHCFYTKRFDEDYPPMWKKLSQITANDFIGLPINLKTEVPSLSRYKKELTQFMDDYIFWSFIGDVMGKCKVGKSLIIFPNTYSNKINLNRFKIDYRVLDKTIKMTYEPLAYILHLFQDAEGNMILPSFIINMPKKNLTYLLRDTIKNSEVFNNEYQIFRTYDRQTAYIFAACIAKIYNTIYLINKNSIPNQRDEWLVTFSKKIKNNAYGIYDKGFLWYKPTKICKNSLAEDLYNIRNIEGKIFVNGTIITI